MRRRAPPAVFAQFRDKRTQQLHEGQLVGRMLLQRLATGATGMKQARYRRGPTRAAWHSYAHVRHIHSRVAIEGPWHLLFNVRQCMV